MVNVMSHTLHYIDFLLLIIQESKLEKACQFLGFGQHKTPPERKNSKCLGSQLSAERRNSRRPSVQLTHQRSLRHYLTRERLPIEDNYR